MHTERHINVKNFEGIRLKRLRSGVTARNKSEKANMLIYRLTRGQLSSHISDRGSLDTNFMDGIILTYGSPRNHIWAFAAGGHHYTTNRHGCPCNSGYSGAVPPYLNGNYFCDSGYRYNYDPVPLNYYTNDPLWDGAGCVSGSCCTFNSPPWFCKNLSTPTTDDIELCLCLDEAISNEDVLFEIVELYVQ